MSLASTAGLASGNTCGGDLTGDATIEVGDLMELLSGWGLPGPGDLDGDGAVDADDLTALIAAWGPCDEPGCADVDPWTYVVIPDTQYFTVWHNGGSPDMFYSQTQWIADNAETMNTKFVSHLGDIVEFGAEDWQWEIADTAMKTVDDVVPVGMVFGNHDADDAIWGRSDIKYNNWFGPSRYTGKAWYGGGYPEGKNTNSWQTFTAGCEEYLTLHLQWSPPADVRSWADQVLAAHPTHRVIVATHEFPGDYVLWNEVLKKHGNVFLVVSGHECARERHIELLNDDGSIVHGILTDYQCDNPSQALLRYYEFDPMGPEIEAVTYSPWNGTYETDSNSAYVFTANYGTSDQGCADTSTTPYGGDAATVPGRIQAEAYDEGCVGYAYQDNETTNQGGAFRTDGVDIETAIDVDGEYNIGWLVAGEWLNYTIDVTADGTYAFTARLAALAAGGTWHIDIDGSTVIASRPVASTSDWQSWVTESLGSVPLTTGQHTLTIHIDSGEFNINWLELAAP